MELALTIATIHYSSTSPPINQLHDHRINLKQVERKRINQKLVNPSFSFSMGISPPHERIALTC